MQSLALDQVRDKIRLKHLSIHTEQAYMDWVKRFILFQQRHPAEMRFAGVEAFFHPFGDGGWDGGDIGDPTSVHGLILDNVAARASLAHSVS